MLGDMAEVKGWALSVGREITFYSGASILALFLMLIKMFRYTLSFSVRFLMSPNEPS